MLHGVVGDSIKGEQGDTVKGNKGDIGPPGPTDAPSQLIIVRHSQNTSIPSCPSGFSSLYTGYSFIFAHGFGFSQGQDLGQSGSCLREFTGIPFVTCSSGFCDSYLRDGHSYWLAVQGVNQPQSNNNVDLISRCNVCEGKATVITVHSQTLSLPNCPSKYSSIWHGFSYFLVTFVCLIGVALQQSYDLCLEHWCDRTRQWARSCFPWIMSGEICCNTIC
jgi:integrin beta 8